MPNTSHLFLIIYVSFCLQVNSLQKEFGIKDGTNDQSDDWNSMKSDSLKNSGASKASTEDPNELDELFPLASEPNKLNVISKLSEREQENFVKDEVFIKEANLKKRFGNSHLPSQKEQNNSEDINVIENLKQPHDLNAEEMSEDPLEANTEVEIGPNASLNLVDSNESSFEVLGERSFIFNPMAEPQEEFQNCTTPKNETGSCKYLQHCLFPTIVSSVTHFMDYVCIIEGRFIGVCCPNLPVSVVVVKEQEEDVKGETELNENCGVATNTRIVGGSDADPKAWPWMVALLTKSKKRFFCGASLINDIYVLVAAHCTFGDTEDFGDDAVSEMLSISVTNNEIIARVGEYDFREDEGTHEEYAIVEMKRHGHYNRRNLRNDIALLKLEKPVKFNEFVQTICFPEGEKDYVGETATLIGWGNLAGGGPTSEVLQQADLPVISNEECAKAHGLPIPESLICTASKAGDTGACNGDSGGPLMLLDENNRWKVIGLVSWGRRGCDPDFPTVYTRVSFFLDWIKKHAT